MGAAEQAAAEQAAATAAVAGATTTTSETQDQYFSQSLMSNPVYSHISAMLSTDHHQSLENFIKSRASKETLKATAFEWMRMAFTGANVRA